MEFYFKTKEEAIKILDRANELIAKYEYVAVNDIKDLMRLEHSSSRYEGWFNIDGADLIQGRDNWILRLPDPEKIF